MAYNKTIVADSIIAALIENESIYSYMNRSYDGLVQQGATSVDIPALPDLVVKTTGTASNHADRKGVKGDTTMVNVPLGVSAIPIKEELLARFETNGSLAQGFVEGAKNSFTQHFDAAVLAAAITTNQVDTFEDAELGWDDLMKVSQIFNTNKVPREDGKRLIIIPSALETEFYKIDVIKNAMAYNLKFFETGFLKINKLTFFVSGLAPQKESGKENIIGIYGPGLAFILSRYMETERVYNPDFLQTNIDFLAHHGAKLLKNTFACVIRQL